MLFLSKLFQRVRTKLCAAAPTESSQSHLNSYNNLINGTRANTNRKKVIVKSFLPPSTVQQVIYDMEKFFVQTDSVTLPKEVHMEKCFVRTDSMTLPEEVQYASSVLKHILEDRDAETRKAREALAEFDKAALGSYEYNTKEK